MPNGLRSKFVGVGFVIALVGPPFAAWGGEGSDPRSDESTARPRLVIQRGGLTDQVAFLPDGQTVLTIGDGAHLWSVAEGWEAGQLSRSSKQIARLPDRRVALADREGNFALLWDLGSDREIRRFDHRAPVSCVALSRDGRTLVTSSKDGLFRVWDTATEDEASHFEIPGGGETFALTPHGSRIVDGAGDLRDARSGELVRRLEGYRSATAPAISRDGRLLLQGDPSYGGRASLWDLATGQRIRQFAFGRNAYAVAISPDGLKAFTGGVDRTVLLWDVATGELIRRFDHETEIKDIAVAPDGGTIVTTTFTKGVPRVWEVASGKLLRTLEGQVESFATVSLSKNGRAILTDSSDPTFRLLDRATGREVRDLPEKKYVRSGMESEFTFGRRKEETLRVWDTADGKEMLRIEHAGQTLAADLSPDAQRVVAIFEGQPPRVLDVATGRDLYRIGSDGGVRTAFFSPDGRHILTMGATTRIWDSGDGRPVQDLVTAGSRPASAVFSGDSRSVLTGGRTVQLWDVATGRHIQKFEHNEGEQVASFSPDGRHVLVLGSAAHLWEIGGEESAREFVQELNTVNGPYRDAVRTASFSPDGHRLLTAGGGPLVWVWNLSTGKELRRLDAGFGVHSIVFSPDGREAVTVGNASILWDTLTWREKTRLPHFTSATFSPDGRTLIGRAFNNKVVSILDGKSGHDLCTLISTHAGSWGVIGSDGRFEANNLESISGLHWVFPDDPFRPLPPEIFIRDYLEPRLLPRLLDPDKWVQLSPIPSLAALNRVQPRVEITRVDQGADPGIARVAVTVGSMTRDFNRGGKPIRMRTRVYDLRLFRDGHLVGRWPEPGGLEGDDPGLTSPEGVAAWRELNRIDLDSDGRAIRDFSVRLSHRDKAGPVEFTAYAFNEDRVKSETARATYDAPASPLPGKPRAYLVCIGVGANEGRGWDLAFAAADARVTAGALSEALTKVDRYEVVPVLLTSERRDDGRLAEASATKANLRAALDLLAGKEVGRHLKASLPGAEHLRAATPDDLVLVLFSGHGYTDPRGTLYLLPYDVGEGQHQVEDVLPRCISTAELSSWLRGVDAGEIAMIVDACHSAAAVQQPGFKPGPLGSRGMGQLAYDKGMRVLAASQADDVAVESYKIRQGLLTYALVRDGLEQRRAARDGMVTLGGLLAYAAERVPTLYREVLAGDIKDGGGATARNVGAVRPRVGQAPAVQRPELFDYERDKAEVMLDSGKAAAVRDY